MKKVLPEEEISKNLIKAIQASSLDEKAFAKAIGLQKQHLMEYIAGKRTPSRISPKLVELGYSSDWYLTGIGEMFVSDVKAKTKEESHYEKLGRAVQELVSEAVKNEREKRSVSPAAESPAEYPPENESIPFYQHLIAAGPCTDSSGPVEEDLELPSDMIPHPADTYAVKVTGDSMKGDNIEEGDVLIVDCSLEPQHNNIVIASVDNEQTVKRLKMDGGKVKLMPSNHHYEPIEITEHTKLDIQGVVTWVIRQTA